MKLVDNGVDPGRHGFVIFVLPEGAARERRTEITSRFYAPGPVASGASVPGRDGVPASSPGARRDATGIPVSVLSSGLQKSRAPGRRPLDEALEARIRDGSNVIDPSLPIS